MSGIYKITCINGKIYIGSAKNIQRRWKEHLKTLRNNIHSNSHLQRAFNKYGESSFVFEIIEECKIDNLIEREQFWIDSYPKDSKFNILEIAYSSLGYKHSEEIKKELSKNRKGKFPSEDHKKKLSKASIGRKKSNEEINKIVSAHKIKVKQINSSGCLIRIYDSMIEAEENTGISRHSISRVCNQSPYKDRNNNIRYLKSAGGYIWEYAN